MDPTRDQSNIEKIRCIHGCEAHYYTVWYVNVGGLDPPTEYRENAKKSRAWRRLGTTQQRVQSTACQLQTLLVAPPNDRSSYPSTGATQRDTPRKVTPAPEHAAVSRKRTRATTCKTQFESIATSTSTSTPSRGSTSQKRGKHEELLPPSHVMNLLIS
jgi:hypothetical protein